MNTATIGIRTAVMSVLSVSLGFGTHLLQGGHAPERASVLLSLLAVAALTMPLMRKRLGVLPTFSLLMLAQWVVHSLASFCAECALGSHHHLDGATEHLDGAGEHLHGVVAGNSASMILGHALIVAAAAWWLSRGEQLFAEAAGILVAGLIRLAPLVRDIVLPRAGANRPVRAFCEPNTLTHLFLGSALVRRGPPAAA